MWILTIFVWFYCERRVAFQRCQVNVLTNVQTFILSFVFCFFKDQLFTTWAANPNGVKTSSTQQDRRLEQMHSGGWLLAGKHGVNEPCTAENCNPTKAANIWTNSKLALHPAGRKKPSTLFKIFFPPQEHYWSFHARGKEENPRKD